jgi:hypothetical protein
LRWTPVRSRSDETGPLNVLIEQSALRQIRQHVAQAGQGVAGLLTGDLNRCPESGQLWLSVEQASPSRGAVPDDAGADILDGIVSPLIREEALQGQRAIGWYLVHSTLGVFLSPGEAEFHQLRFPEVWQVAIVLLEDPERPAAGVFLRAPDGTLSRSGYASFYERLHRSSLLPEGQKRSFVGWSNHSTEEPVVVAGSDGVSDDLSDLPEPAAPDTNEKLNGVTPQAAALDAGPAGGEPPRPGVGQYKAVTPVAAGPDAETGPSEEAHDRAQMKRALSAVDFSITALPDPISAVANDDTDGELADDRSSTSADTSDTQPLAWERFAAGSEPEPTPQSEPIGAGLRQRHGSGYARSTRLSRIVWSAFGFLLVGTLLWLVFQGEQRSVSGEPAPDLDDAPPIQVDARGPVPAAASDTEPSPVATSASLGEPPAVDLTPEVVPPPVEVVIDEPFETNLLVSPGADEPSSPTSGGSPEITVADSVSAGLRAQFLTALEIFGQESAGYQERREAYERGLVGCNALNSWYRSVGDAFVRLSSKVVEAGPERASIWRAEYEDARTGMDEIDRHYLASECPLPR